MGKKQYFCTVKRSIVTFGLVLSQVAVFASRPDSLLLDSVQQSLLDSMERMFTLQEVVVTAKEITNSSSASVIGKEAMEHLQPSSFADLTNMLPGARIKDPNLTNCNTIHLREACDGTSSDQYSTGALGTGFVIDGAPVSTDANMQYIQGASSNQDDARQTVNKGVDMRTIPTDDIEKVEIIRGVANAEYGDITSGVVKIERSAKPTPWRARFKADGFSKLFFVGKGLGWNDNTTVLNFALDYLNAKADPTNTLENYQRITASVRVQQQWKAAAYRIKWQSNMDYTGSIDAEKVDPDIHYNREDSYRSEYHKASWSNTLHYSSASEEWWSASLLANVSVEKDCIAQSRFVQLTTPVQPAIDNMQEGNATVGLLPYRYVAHHAVEGLPLNIFIRPKAQFYFDTWCLNHKAAAGIEWKYDKNYGAGQVYDLRRPLNYQTAYRPRAYRDIPAANQLAWYIQDDIHIPLAHRPSDDSRQREWSLDMSVGLRGASLLGLERSYAIRGKCYVDPRANLTLNMPVRNGHIHVGASVGRHTKMPTLLMLYPNTLYYDLKAPDITVSQTDTAMNIYTHIIRPANCDLRPARNMKWEVRAGLEIDRHNLNITYFREKMDDGFRSWTQCESLHYGITDKNILHDYTRLITYSIPVNGSTIRKQGIEWQYQSPRIKAICTRFTVNGAWLRTEYQNSVSMFSSGSLTAVVNGRAVSDTYIGLYDWNDGTIRENINTNIIADVHIPRIGLTVSATLELCWMTASQTMVKNGVPTAYMDATDGQLHPYTEADRTDPVLQHLVFTYNANSFRRRVEPFAGYLNLRVQKSITRYANIAFYVNRLLDYLPDYEVDGVTVHRNVSSYFGMEINLHI